MSDRDRALQMLRQSDHDNSIAYRDDIQSKQRLLQTRAYNQDIPGGIVEGFHRECAKETRRDAEPGPSQILACLLT